MSNQPGSVDVIRDRERDRERQARLQQCNEYRDPSPQPIFSQPVKVELEDATSRLIKDTLGDFTGVRQLLISDPKHLIGISGLREVVPGSTPSVQANSVCSTRSSHASDYGDPSTSSSWPPSRNSNGSSHPSSNHHSSNRSVPAKRPVPPYNGQHKAPTSAFDASASSKRAHHHPSSKQASGGDKKVHHNNHHHHPAQSKHNRLDHPPKINPISNSYNGPSDPERFQDKGARVPSAHQDRDRRTKSVPVPPNNVSSGLNPVPPGGSAHSNHNSSANCNYNSSAVKQTPPQPSPPPPILQNGSLPNGLISDRKRFCDPVSASKRTLPKQSIPKLSIPPQEDRNDLSHFEVESILKEMKQAVPPPLTAIQTPRTEERGFNFASEIKKEESYGKSSLRECKLTPFDREAVPLIVSPDPLPLSPAKKSPFNIQDDLEISDSDDEGSTMVPLKTPELSELAPCPKSPMREETDVKPSNPTATQSMGATEKSESLGEDDGGHVQSANSSSSESSDSESEDSGSESNDSESSSEASELEVSTKPDAEKWGLRNFIIESQRNHSPGLALDTNTNSSCPAVKDDPPASAMPDKDDFSIADEDSVNCLLASKYSDRDINFRSPPDDFFITNPIMKSISPIASPVPPPPAPVPRGPRTPPFPPDDEDDDEPEVDRRKEPKRDASDADSEELVTSRSKSLPNNKSSPFKPEKSNSSSAKGRSSEDRHSRSKKKPQPKTKKEDPSPKTKDERRKSSASRESPAEASKDASSRPVPSAVSRATHRSPLKPPHRHSAPAKRDSSQTESNNKAFPENKNELSTKSKNASRHPEQLEDAPSSSRGNSRGSSATRTADVPSTTTPAKADAGKPEPRAKHSQRSKESHKPSSGQKVKASGGKTSSKSKPKSESKPPAAETKKPSEKRKKSSKFSIKNFLQEPDQSSSNLNEPSPKLASARSSPALQDSPDVSPRRDDDGDVDSDDSAVRQSRPIARNRSREGIRHKSSSSSSSRSRSRSGSRSSKQLENRNVKSSGGVKRPTSRSSEQKKKHRSVMRSTPEADLNADNSKSHLLPSQSSPAPPPLTQMLSPIHSGKSESALPSLMVSIPLSKLLRIPGKPRNPEIPPKGAQEATQPSSNQRTSTSRAASPPPKKDFKAKHRTESSKSVSNSTGDKGSKSAKSESVSSKINSPAVSEKSGLESSEHSSKSSKVTDGQPVAKKRKSSDKPDAEHGKKKARVSSSQISVMSPKSSDALEQKMREKTPIVKIERMDKAEICAQSEKRTPTKRLERRDSTSSLSSLCSQQSQKSSKSSKEKIKCVPKEGGEKKVKVVKPMILAAKEIKKEKEEKPKISVKKELGVVVKSEKMKSRTKEKFFSKTEMVGDSMKLPGVMPGDGLNPSSQLNYWERVSKIDDIKPQPTNHQRIPMVDYSFHQDLTSDFERFVPDIQQELKSLPSHINNRISEPVQPMAYYFAEGKKLKSEAAKEMDPIRQAFKYFEATVMFILTSLHRELSNKDPDSIYQMYSETLKFSAVIRNSMQKNAAPSGPLDFKINVLCLKCQSLLHLKLYNLKMKEIKEQHKFVAEFIHSSAGRLVAHSSPQPAGSSSHSRNLSQPSPCQPRVGAGLGSVPSPHSPTPSPAGSVASVGSQSSGYSSSELNGNPSRPHSSLQLPHIMPQPLVSVPQNVYETMVKHHTHLTNLYYCHELWEQADMYMTRSNSKDFFKEVAEKSEKLSLHSTIKDLVSYLQAGLELMKNC